MTIIFDGANGLELLREGDKLIYTAGQGEHHIRALAVVVRNGQRGGATGRYVRIERILDHGGESGITEGKEVVAARGELSRPDVDAAFLRMLASRA